MENSGIRNTEHDIVISYLTYRKAIGWLGVSLPFALVIGTMMLGSCSGIQESISHYYYTIMGDVFVGTLCCLGLFLLTYRYERIDNIASSIAGIFAICVALFPTTNLFSDASFRTLEPICDSIYHTRTLFHFASAALFLGTLAFMSLVLFTKTSPGGKIQGKKKTRNKIYKICGWLMILAIVFIAVISFSPVLDPVCSPYHYTFWGECIALWAFGISWLIKGGVLLSDN